MQSILSVSTLGSLAVCLWGSFAVTKEASRAEYRDDFLLFCFLGDWNFSSTSRFASSEMEALSK